MTRTHQPRGSMCQTCANVAQNCEHLPFEAMPVIELHGAIRIVRCTDRVPIIDTAPTRMELSLWTVTDEYGKRVRTSHKLTAEEARERFPNNPVIVPGTTEVRDVPGNSLYTVATSYDGRLD